MVLICTNSSRRLTTDSRYLQMAQTSLGPGKVKPCNGETNYLDFSDPTRASLRVDGDSVDFFLVPQGDPIHGFPNPRAMTNFAKWRCYYICLSDGLIWTCGWLSNAWSVVAYPNNDIRSSNSRNIYLYVEENTLTLVEFMDDQQVCIHEYTLKYRSPASTQPSSNTANTEKTSRSSFANAERRDVGTMTDGRANGLSSSRFFLPKPFFQSIDYRSKSQHRLLQDLSVG